MNRDLYKQRKRVSYKQRQTTMIIKKKKRQQDILDNRQRTFPAEQGHRSRHGDRHDATHLAHRSLHTQPIFTLNTRTQIAIHDKTSATGTSYLQG